MALWAALEPLPAMCLCRRPFACDARGCLPLDGERGPCLRLVQPQP